MDYKFNVDYPIGTQETWGRYTDCTVVSEDPIPLKPDSQYPEWLWNLRTDRKPPPLNQLDRNSYQFWRRVRRDNQKRWGRLATLDGWHRRDHKSPDDHVARFYGDWLILLGDRFKTNVNKPFN
ncbi:unnamed protein product [Dicrocoelium dendriticum]|nr:unnamed protein product [Dicrocoelium dendriticum]